MLVILSTASVASANVRDEIAYALDHQKRIIPVLVSECEIPIRIRTDYGRGLRLRLRSLGVAAQAPAPNPAEVAVEKAKAEQASKRAPTGDTIVVSVPPDLSAEMSWPLSLVLTRLGNGRPCTRA